MAPPVCIADEQAAAVSAERLWKIFLDPHAAPEVFAGFIDAVEVEGGGGLGTISTMKVNPASGGGSYKSQVVVCDKAAWVIKWDMLEAPPAKMGDKLKSHSTEFKLQPTGNGSCLVDVKVEYERLGGGGGLSPDDEKTILEGYVHMFKMSEAYLVAHPAEYA
ncbi:hypothetical protein GUJ93_ZPchr0009g2078 [Zizania palustris]|uniref:Bet v I/Major latex protein domain-containing protein n=1 Tax=Zizania palustris TaxID=103762 RepID=A0A8J5VIS5_ZIZPA|nr:hypothetical protein GUJ93_ZPchr0009g2078 [Zizania palustris]